MSYRIHIRIIDKEEFNTHIDNVKQGNIRFYDGLSSKRYEIPNDMDIVQFTPIDIYQDECQSYILNKNDFLTILKYYQDLQIELAEYEINKVNKIRSDKSIDINHRDVIDVINTHRTRSYKTKKMFESLKRDDTLIEDSYVYLYQYFLLVGLYNNFDDDTQAILITHG